MPKHAKDPDLPPLATTQERERAAFQAGMHVLAEKLRAELMNSLIGPLVKGEPARVVAAKALDAREIFEGAGGVGKHPTIAEHLRHVARDKGSRKPEWEVYHALQGLVDEMVPGRDTEERRKNLRDNPIAHDAITVNAIDSRVEEPRKLGRHWSLVSYMNDLQAKFPPDSDPRSPSLLATLVARLDDARRTYRAGETYLQPMPKETSGVLQPPKTSRVLEIIGDAERRVHRPYAQEKLGTAPDPDGGEDVDNSAEVQQAMRAGKAIVKSQRREARQLRSRRKVTEEAENEPTSRLLAFRAAAAAVGGAAAGAYFTVQAHIQNDWMLLAGTVGAVGTAAALMLRDERKGIQLIAARRALKRGQAPLLRAEAKVEEEKQRLFKQRPQQSGPQRGG